MHGNNFGFFSHLRRRDTAVLELASPLL